MIQEPLPTWLDRSAGAPQPYIEDMINRHLAWAKWLETKAPEPVSVKPEPVGQHWPQNAGALDPKLAGYWLDQSTPNAARIAVAPLLRRASRWRRFIEFITRRIG